jgi:hypothetical protein
MRVGLIFGLHNFVLSPGRVLTYRNCSENWKKLLFIKSPSIRSFLRYSCTPNAPGQWTFHGEFDLQKIIYFILLNQYLGKC